MVRRSELRVVNSDARECAHWPTLCSRTYFRTALRIVHPYFRRACNDDSGPCPWQWSRWQTMKTKIGTSLARNASIDRAGACMLERVWLLSGSAFVLHERLRRSWIGYRTNGHSRVVTTTVSTRKATAKWKMRLPVLAYTWPHTGQECCLAT